jgi:manganese/zinc/iron transport system substrate-binding protein
MKNVLFVLGVFIPILWGCHPATSETTSGPIKVVATTGMIGDAARILGGEAFSVHTLIGSGLDPHLYKATEGDVRRLHEAQVILYHGLHLEGKLTEILGAMSKQKTTVAVAEALPENQRLVPPDGGGQWDPHVWFDVQRWIVVVQKIATVLVDVQPDQKMAIDMRLNKYLQELQSLHETVQTEISRIPEQQRILVTAHDAFHYFGDAYGVEVTGLQGISTVVEAGARDVQELANWIVERKVPAIFVESSVPKKSILALREAVSARGGSVSIGDELFSDAMGPAGSGADSYLGMVQHNVRALVNGLAGSAGEATAAVLAPGAVSGP